MSDSSMPKLLKKCPRCGRYTLRESCPICGEKTVSPYPPKFRLNDKYGKYRRMWKVKDGHVD